MAKLSLLFSLYILVSIDLRGVVCSNIFDGGKGDNDDLNLCPPRCAFDRRFGVYFFVAGVFAGVNDVVAAAIDTSLLLRLYSLSLCGIFDDVSGGE